MYSLKIKYIIRQRNERNGIGHKEISGYYTQANKRGPR
jgi:hypothetical protein